MESHQKRRSRKPLAVAIVASALALAGCSSEAQLSGTTEDPPTTQSRVATTQPELVNEEVEPVLAPDASATDSGTVVTVTTEGIASLPPEIPVTVEPATDGSAPEHTHDDGTTHSNP